MARRLALLVFLLVCALSLAQLVLAFGALPQRVPTHFSLAGQPDAYGSRNGLIILNTALLIFDALLFLGLPWLMERLPDDLINLPRKEHWLAPERRRATLAALGTYLLWMGTATQVLMMDLLAQTVRVGTGAQSALGHGPLSLGLYLVFTGLWVAALFRRFASVS